MTQDEAIAVVKQWISEKIMKLYPVGSFGKSRCPQGFNPEDYFMFSHKPEINSMYLESVPLVGVNKKTGEVAVLGRFKE